MMIKHLVSTTDLGGEISPADVEEICNLVMGSPVDPERPWMYEIVANKRNGIDVDKFDYLIRDTQKINMHQVSFSPMMIIQSARIVDGLLCYPEKYDFEIKKLFESRYNLYRDAYYHRVTQSFECLLLDIMIPTHGVLVNYLEAIRDPEQYVNLDDSIIHEIRMSREPELARSRELVARLDSRNFYSFVGEKGLSTEKANQIKSISEAQVIEAYKQSVGDCPLEEVALTAADIVVRKYNINMG